MQVAVVEKTFRIVGKGSLIAQFTFISSGTLHIWFPDVGLQMEAHCKQLRIEDCTIIYTNGLHHGQPRALWSLTLHPDDMSELKRILQQFNTSLYLTLPASHYGYHQAGLEPELTQLARLNCFK